MSTTGRQLPSATEICLAECTSLARTKKLARDRRFLQELRDQALHDLAEYPYVDTLDCTEPLDPNEFILYASNDLSPFLPDGKCICGPCRLRYAGTFARGIGLYAEVVVLSDHFSGAVIKTPPGEWSVDQFVSWVDQFRCLEPLMRGGVIRFSRWIYSRCSACGDVARRAEKQIAARLVHDIWNTTGIEIGYGPSTESVLPVPGTPAISISSPVLSGADGPLWFRCGLTKTFQKTLARAESAARRNNGIHATFGQKLQKFLNPRLLTELQRFVDGAVFSATMSRMCNATVATDSPLGARVLSYLDELDTVGPDAGTWALPPTSELPWLKDLSPEDVMSIRSEAHEALPAFRALIRSRLFIDEGQRATLIDELRAGVAEVEAEFRHLRVVRRRSLLLSLSGLMLAVYGFGTRDAAIIGSGLGGFVSSLAAAHNSIAQAELREHGLIHKPAYLLFTAGSTAHQRRRPRTVSRPGQSRRSTAARR
jgi:hypothetical protein